MAEKKSVTVPLTARQKQQIKRATGKTISALKVGPSGGMVAARRFRILETRVVAARKVAAGRKVMAARKVAAGRKVMAARKVAAGRKVMAARRTMAARKMVS